MKKNRMGKNPPLPLAFPLGKAAIGLGVAGLGIGLGHYLYNHSGYFLYDDDSKISRLKTDLKVDQDKQLAALRFELKADQTIQLSELRADLKTNKESLDSLKAQLDQLGNKWKPVEEKVTQVSNSLKKLEKRIDNADWKAKTDEMTADWKAKTDEMTADWKAKTDEIGKELNANTQNQKNITSDVIGVKEKLNQLSDKVDTSLRDLENEKTALDQSSERITLKMQDMEAANKKDKILLSQLWNLTQRTMKLVESIYQKLGWPVAPETSQ